MKAVIFGATGLAGSAVLDACIANEKITQVFLIVRKAFDDERAKNKKVEAIINKDMAQYPPEVIDKLKGVELVLWTIGGMVNKFNGDWERCYEANVTLCKAAADAMLANLPQHSPTSKICFVLGSGQYTEQDQTKKLYFLQQNRRMKGEIETYLENLAKENPTKFTTYATRPGLIVPKNPPFSTRLMNILAGGITAENVGKCMVSVGVNGWKERVLEQDAMMKSIA